VIFVEFCQHQCTNMLLTTMVMGATMKLSQRELQSGTDQVFIQKKYNLTMGLVSPRSLHI
jgi:hypothetical protein